MTTITLSDDTYAQMESYIRPLVEALNKRGIVTVGSCEGHLNASPYPWVIIDYQHTNPLALVRFIHRLAEHNCKHPGTLLEWELFPHFASMYGNSGLFLYLRPRDKNPQHHGLHLAVMQNGIQKLVEHLADAKAAPFGTAFSFLKLTTFNFQDLGLT